MPNNAMGQGQMFGGPNQGGMYGNPNMNNNMQGGGYG